MDKKYYIIIITIFIIIVLKNNFDLFDIISPPINEKKIAVIFPYREQVQQNRSQQLKDTLDYYTKLNKPNIDYYIIEQGNDKPFNRGVLINAGHDILKKSNLGYENEVHHDIDVQANEEFIKYFSSDNVVGKPRYNDSKHFGNISILPLSIMEQANGYSNNYWGWGGEDNNFRERIEKENISIYRPIPKINKMKYLPHIKATELNLKNTDLDKVKRKDKEDGYISGLVDLKYTIISEEKLSDHVFKITIDF
jgi:beta-1,4-galactosyltransferase 4